MILAFPNSFVPHANIKSFTLDLIYWWTFLQSECKCSTPWSHFLQLFLILRKFFHLFMLWWINIFIESSEVSYINIFLRAYQYNGNQMIFFDWACLDFKFTKHLYSQITNYSTALILSATLAWINTERSRRRCMLQWMTWPVFLCFCCGSQFRPKRRLERPPILFGFSFACKILDFIRNISVPSMEKNDCTNQTETQRPRAILLYTSCFKIDAEYCPDMIRNPNATYS